MRTAEASAAASPERAEPTDSVGVRALKSKPDPASAKRRMQSESTQTRRTAALVLEVLGGVRTPTEAAEALGVSVPRFYAIEARALEGLVGACRRRPRGPQPSAAREVKRLEVEVTRLKEECARTQALLRVAQRAIGLKAPRALKKPTAPAAEESTSGGKKKRRKRRATARALRAVRILEEGSASESSELRKSRSSSPSQSPPVDSR
ncbi:MAG: hypothetical protein AB7T31_18895 [Gemmatimonadales bacterium]